MEVVLALGVFSVAVVAILGMVPGLLQISKESWQETRANQIATQILSDLQGDENGKAWMVTSTTPEVGSSGRKAIDLETAATHQQDYDSEGNAVAVGAADATFLAEIQVLPQTGRRGLSDIAIVIRPQPLGSASGSFHYSSKVAASQLGAAVPPPTGGTP